MKHSSAFRVRVLVIDDEKDLLELLSLALRRRGCVVSVADSGEAGVAAARAAEFDVVICDVVMPGMDGPAVLEVLKRERPTIEVIMVTGSPRAETGARCAQLGAFEYLSKPYRLSELFAAVDAAAVKRRGSA